MTTPQNPHFTTQIVHADRLGGAEHGAIHQPVHTSVQYGFDKVEDLIAVFQGTDEQKGRWLPGLADGSSIMAFGITDVAASARTCR